jgi:hypothetical protein
LSITPESQKGQQAAEIPISDIYFFTRNDAKMRCYDVCVAILKESVKCDGKIIPGVPLARLNVMDDIKIDKKPLYHLSWDRSSSGKLINAPTVIGYGRTGASIMI